MSHIVTVEMLHPEQDLLDEEGSLLLCQSFSLRDKIKQLAAAETEMEKIYKSALI